MMLIQVLTIRNPLVDRMSIYGVEDDLGWISLSHYHKFAERGVMVGFPFLSGNPSPQSISKPECSIIVCMCVGGEVLRKNFPLSR